MRDAISSTESGLIRCRTVGVVLGSQAGHAEQRCVGQAVRRLSEERALDLTIIIASTTSSKFIVQVTDRTRQVRWLRRDWSQASSHGSVRPLIETRPDSPEAFLACGGGYEPLD